MKKYLIIIASLSVLLFSACKNETTSGLDGSVSERIEKTHREFQKILSDSPHGWIAYVETNQGLYRFWMEFDEVSKVSMLTDNSVVEDGAKEISVSDYSIRQYQRPTLVFDTYTYLSVINDPDDAISHGKDNQGLESDFEFEFVSYGEVEYNIGDGIRKYDAFKMEGRINLSKCLLIKATQEQKEEAHKERLAAEVIEVGIYGGGVNNHLTAKINNDDVFFLVKSRTVIAITEEVEGVVVEECVPILEVKSKNLLLDDHLKAAGVMIESFRWDEIAKSYYAVVGDNEFLLSKSTTAPDGLLDKLFGYKKPFTRLRMYKNYGYVMLDFYLLELSGVNVTAIDLYLSEDAETREKIMVVEIWLLDMFPLAYSFPIIVDSDGAFTTTDKISFDNDISLLAETFYEDGLTSSFVDRFKSLTYTVAWGDTAPPAEYENETIIMFKSTSGVNNKNGVMIR